MVVTKILLCLLLVTDGTWSAPYINANRLTISESDSYFYPNHMGPGTYAFGYDVEDSNTGNVQFRREEKLANGTVIGSYGYVDAEGKTFIVNYVSDSGGYRAKIEKDGMPSRRFPNKIIPASNFANIYISSHIHN